MERRRAVNCFLQWLSMVICIFSFIGAAWVLCDPRISFSYGTFRIELGQIPFSSDLKGAVISAILIGGFAGVTGYWLGASNTNRIPTQTFNVENKPGDTHVKLD